MQEAMELDWLKRWALYSPKAVALACSDSQRAFTYLELYERSNALAAKLRATYGITKGERVAVLAHNEPETVILFFALQRLGAILVPINFRFAAREVDHVLRDSESKLFIYQEAFSEICDRLESKPAQSLPFEGSAGLSGLVFSDAPCRKLEVDAEFESPVMILYTSGTTGAPKGALLTNRMLFWNSVNTGLRLNLVSTDSTIVFQPFFHTGGWNVLTTPLLHHGGKVILLKKFDPDRVLELCEKEKPTVIFGLPTMLDRMARASRFKSVNLSSLRYLVAGGEPMPVELIEIWGTRGIPVRQGFGLTEFGPNVFSLNAEDAVRKKGSIGSPNFYIEARIVDTSTGEEITKPNVVGELLLRGPSCMAGYWKNEKATAETIRDGWLYTGDLVRRDEEGYFYVAGRRKEMFISGGENVYPVEVEQFLRTHPRIREAAVVGMRDETWGETGRCFYATETGTPLPEPELRAFCQSGLAKFKVPKSFVHLSELPKGDSGKILKKMLQLQ